MKKGIGKKEVYEIPKWREEGKERGRERGRKVEKREILRKKRR